jgi:S-adenosylmethionine:tRNA ribosyltransferase-isomerase
VDISELDYELPDELIARHPAAIRGASRLLGLDRTSGKSRDLGTVNDIIELVRPGDVWVFNDTRVRPARIFAKKSSGGRVELLVLSDDAGLPGGELSVRATAMYKSSKALKAGTTLSFYRRPRNGEEPHGTPGSARVVHNLGDGLVVIEADTPIADILDAAGEIPLPPYLARLPEASDAERYQTVFARVPGAVAAPTAGLHFTEALVAAIRARGAEVTTLTLHVGPGTFRPIKAERVEDHVMHEELMHVPESTAALVNAARRVVAVGTTSVRALETAASFATDGMRCNSFRGATRLFLTPGYEFRAVDALFTNFHIPGSSLLALVGAFAGMAAAKSAYVTAIARRYRFYSYGDAMFIAAGIAPGHGEPSGPAPAPPASTATDAGLSAVSGQRSAGQQPRDFEPP